MNERRYKGNKKETRDIQKDSPTKGAKLILFLRKIKHAFK